MIYMNYEMNLESIPVSKTGKFQWANSIGLSVQAKSPTGERFELEIVGYNRRYVTVNVNGKQKEITTDQFRLGEIQSIMLEDKDLKRKKYKVGDVVELNTGKVVIEEIKKRKVNHSMYTVLVFRCMTCGQRSEYYQCDFERLHNCPVCRNRSIVPGYNSIADLKPEIAALMTNKEDTRKYSIHSRHLVDFKCPKCNKIIQKSIHYVSQFGLTCPDCGRDNISYPEYLIGSFLKNLGYKIESEKSFPWSIEEGAIHPYRYDFYIPAFNTIIEAHGIQHFKENKFFDLSLEEIQGKDERKKELAYNHDISGYVTLDCSYSQPNYIKRKLLKNEKFMDLLKLSNKEFDNDIWEDSVKQTQEYFDKIKGIKNGMNRCN